jgi:hypothetical protein
MPKPSKKEISQAADDMLKLMLTSPNAGFLKDFIFEYVAHEKGKVAAATARVLCATSAIKPMFSSHIAEETKHIFSDDYKGNFFDRQGWEPKKQAESAVLMYAIEDLVDSSILDPKNTKHIEAWLIKNPAMQTVCKKALLVSGKITEASLKTPKAIAKGLCHASIHVDFKDYLEFGSILLGRPLPHAADWEKAIIQLRKDAIKNSTGFVAPQHTTPEILPPPMTPLLPKSVGLVQRC